MLPLVLIFKGPVGLPAALGPIDRATDGSLVP